MNSLMIGLILITSDLETEYSDFAIRDAMRNIAISWEIMDPREQRYFLTMETDFKTDLKLIRRRYTEFKDCPLMAAGFHLPCREDVNNWLSFNRTYRTHLDTRMSIDLTRWFELRQAIQDCDVIYHKLDLVRDYGCDYYYITVRRQALKKLADQYGLYNIDYCPVPLRYFTEIK